MKLIEAGKDDFKNFNASFEDCELGKFYFSSQKLIDDTFAEFMKKKTILTAVSEKTVIGFICHIPGGAFHGYTYLHILTVIPAFRGKGFGGRMLGIFEEGIREYSSKIFLSVAEFNPSARSFYEKNGYIHVGTIPDLYRPGISELLMMKNLK